MADSGRFGATLFICRRGSGEPRRRVPLKRHTGAGVRFVTCACGGQFMAVQGQATPCPKCGARGGEHA